MSIDTPSPDFTVMTITHTGTRWIDSCFQNANIPIKVQHFGWGRPIEGIPFTLLRDPYDVIKSFIYRELEVKSYINQLDMQDSFLNGIWIQGGVPALIDSQGNVLRFPSVEETYPELIQIIADNSIVGRPGLNKPISIDAINGAIQLQSLLSLKEKIIFCLRN